MIRLHRRPVLLTLLLSILLALAAGQASAQQSRQPLPGQGSSGGTQVVENETQGSTAPGADPFLKYKTDVQLSIGQVELQDFPTVRAFVTVRNPDGSLIRTLKAEEFSVLENDVAAQNVRFANRAELNLPLAIQFVVDISGSMDGSMEMEVEAIKSFVAQLSPEDRVGLVTFSDGAIRNLELTTDHDALLRQLDRLTPWGQTALWDGLMLGMQELLADPEPARRALIVLSDGLDNLSTENPSGIMQWHEEHAVEQNKGFSVFALGLGTEIDRGPLGQIATKTGGVYLDSPSAADLENVYQTILSQIQSEYIIEYDAPVESEPTEIIDMTIGLNNVQSYVPATYTYRSPGLSQALSRLIWPGLAAIAALLLILIIATIYRITRRVWLTVMITPLEGKDYSLPLSGADIGSMEACDVRIGSDAAILPIHARLRETADGFMLEAVDPLAPIFAGQRMLARKLLRSGDRFRLGRTEFQFNERVVRPGDGREQLVDAELFKAPVQITEEQQLGTASSAVRQPPTRLTAVSGPYAGQSFELKQGENLVGRKEGSIVLEKDDQLSRRHVMISLVGDVATLTDEGSTNGTQLNGRACQPGISQPVFAGDTLKLGRGEFRLE